MLLRIREQRQGFYEDATPAAIVFSALLAAIIIWLTKCIRELRANEPLQTELVRPNARTAHRIRIIMSLANQAVEGDMEERYISSQASDFKPGTDMVNSLNLLEILLR